MHIDQMLQFMPMMIIVFTYSHTRSVIYTVLVLIGYIIPSVTNE